MTRRLIQYEWTVEVIDPDDDIAEQSHSLMLMGWDDYRNEQVAA